MSVQSDTPIGDTEPPEVEAYTLLRQVNSIMDTYNRFDLRSEELTVPQFMILNYSTVDGVPLSEISARMLCDNSNLTGIVDRLIAKGYVRRKPDPQDRRVSLICLTAAGADKLRRIKPRHHARVSRRMRTLSQAQVQELRDILQRLYASLQYGPPDEESAGD
jgi:MarR family 2-MHQ and catechol resistance regulon transcriptional repressor